MKVRLRKDWTDDQLLVELCRMGLYADWLQANANSQWTVVGIFPCTTGFDFEMWDLVPGIFGGHVQITPDCLEEVVEESLEEYEIRALEFIRKRQQ